MPSKFAGTVTNWGRDSSRGGMDASIQFSTRGRLKESPIAYRRVLVYFTGQEHELGSHDMFSLRRNIIEPLVEQ